MITLTLNDTLVENTNHKSYGIAQKIMHSVPLLQSTLYRDNKAFSVIDSQGETQLKNPGLIGMLSHAYSNHIGISLSPTDLWIVLMSEMAQEVNNQPELYRHFFTDSEKKKLLTVQSDSLTVMPMASLQSVLSGNVNFDSAMLFPVFSTNTAVTNEVLQALFCDMSSSYYDYGMYLCGIPAIELQGTQSDWQTLKEHFNQVLSLFSQVNQELTIYANRVNPILDNIILTFENPEGQKSFWMDIFTQKNVGSGGDLTINGWISQLFITEHQMAKITNFTNTYALVQYQQLNTGRKFAAVYGGFDAQKNAQGFLQLAYSRHIFEMLEGEMARIYKQQQEEKRRQELKQEILAAKAK
jgi:hypothetical protein